VSSVDRTYAGDRRPPAVTVTNRRPNEIRRVKVGAPVGVEASGQRRQSRRERVRLPADLGDRGGLPQRAAPQRTDDGDRGRCPAVVADERAVGADIESETERAGARVSACDQVPDQLRVRVAEIEVGTRAVDHPVRLEQTGLVARISNRDSLRATRTALDAATDSTTGGKLVGLFKVAPGSYSGSGPASGSYFRMVQSGGTLSAGPFVSNGDSTCTTKTYTALQPGTQAGLITDGYQEQPSPPFDAQHNGAAAAITQPTKFFAVGFALSTNPKDPQTGANAPAPEITASASGKLSGDLSAVGVSWNGQQFNEGAPKPDGAESAGTTAPTGTFDSTTGAYTLEWTSQIAGGPFNGFTGVWHLEGTFVKK
jgi:hypothetical protein